MKTVERKYFVCEICGKTSQSEEKIRECGKKHLILTDDCAIDCKYPKGKEIPSEITVTFPDGTVAGYYLRTVSSTCKKELISERGMKK